VVGARQTAALYYDDIEVSVRHDGEQITIEASFIVPVVPRQAWAVLTDFESLPYFNPGIVASKVTERTGNTLQVWQKGVSKYGFLSFSYESLREIQLIPFSKIHERMLSGTMRKMEETTRLSPKGRHTRITYHAVIIPDVWVSPALGSVFIKQEAREQFQQLANEIVRRQTK